MALHGLLAPDGYLLGWNQGGVLHPHMHVIPRFDDEPLSDRWLRSAINVPETDGPIHGRPGAAGNFGVPGEPGRPGPVGSGWCCSFRGRLRPFLGTVTSLQVAGLGHPMSRDPLVRSRHTPVSPRNLKRRRMSAAAAPASRKDAR
jgi:hypothetical protein